MSRACLRQARDASPRYAFDRQSTCDLRCTMHLARHAITSTPPTQVLDARFSAEDSALFTAATPTGFAVYRSSPLQLLSKRSVPSISNSNSTSNSRLGSNSSDEEGTLAFVVPCHVSSVLYLVGGGPSPVFPPNKVVVWDDAKGRAVAELEFRERVRGVVTRRGWLIVALRRRVVAFEVGEEISRYAEWETGENVRGMCFVLVVLLSFVVCQQLNGCLRLIRPDCGRDDGALDAPSGDWQANRARQAHPPPAMPPSRTDALLRPHLRPPPRLTHPRPRPPFALLPTYQTRPTPRLHHRRTHIRSRGISSPALGPPPRNSL